MLTRVRHTLEKYPSQFWLIFWGQLIATFGASMIWPFMMIYVSERLGLPMTIVAGLLTLNAIMRLVTSFIAGPIADRVGRKGVMVVSLAANGLIYLIMIPADSLAVFAILMMLRGAFNPLYRVGADAMMADLVPEKDRADAYSLMRMSKNVGVAMGPAIGGFVAVASYATAFYIAAIGMVIYSILIAVQAKETLPKEAIALKEEVEAFGGYLNIFKDKPFISFISTFTLTQTCGVMVWVLLAVYAKQNFQVPENQYGLIPTTNAIMVVLFQFAVTQVTKKLPDLRMMALGSFFYAVGVGGIALGGNFWGFWLCMVIITIGELILVPTATTYAANLAPVDKRGRYMSLFALTWGIAAGLGPILGGFLNDNLGPRSIWLGGGLVGLMAVVGFMWLSSRSQLPEPARVVK